MNAWKVSPAALLVGLLWISAPSEPGVAFADIEKKPKQEKPEPAKKGDRPPEDARQLREDPRVRVLSLRLGDWESALGRVTIDGLDATAFLAPDALTYKCSSTYLGLRRTGKTHEEAIGTLKKLVPRWQRYKNACLLILKMRNRKFDGRDDAKRVYTLTKNLAKDGVVVRAGKKKRLATQLAGMPANLRVAKLRVMKFYTTADGFTRRVQPRPPGDDGSSRDPASIGRKPKTSKPFRGLVLESGEAEVELLLSRKQVERTRQRTFRVELPGWKRYEGPWREDILDLNESRTWSAVEGLAFDLPMPPSGWRVASELTRLVEEVRD